RHVLRLPELRLAPAIEGRAALGSCLYHALPLRMLPEVRVRRSKLSRGLDLSSAHSRASGNLLRLGPRFGGRDAHISCLGPFAARSVVATKCCSCREPPRPACGERSTRAARRVRGTLQKFSSWRFPLTRIASQSDLSPQAGRGDSRHQPSQ